MLSYNGEHIKEFEQEIRDLAIKYGVSELSVGCYLSNFEDVYLCKTYNGGCAHYVNCSELRKKLIADKSKDTK